MDDDIFDKIFADDDDFDHHHHHQVDSRKEEEESLVKLNVYEEEMFMKNFQKSHEIINKHEIDEHIKSINMKLWSQNQIYPPEEEFSSLHEGSLVEKGSTRSLANLYRSLIWIERVKKLLQRHAHLTKNGTIRIELWKKYKNEINIYETKHQEKRDQEEDPLDKIYNLLPSPKYSTNYLAEGVRLRSSNLQNSRFLLPKQIESLQIIIAEELRKVTNSPEAHNDIESIRQMKEKMKNEIFFNDPTNQIKFWQALWSSTSIIFKRHPKECEAAWIHYIDSSRKPWTAKEELDLLDLLKNNNFIENNSPHEPSKWNTIAIKLKTNRTAFACLQHYQRALNQSLTEREWTEEEDKKLQFLALHKFNHENSVNRFRRIAEFFAGRTNTQCRSRFYATLKNPNLQKARWTPEEDLRLQVATRLYGRGHWAKVAFLLKGRTDMKCRERYENTLAPELKKGNFDDREDFIIIEQVAKNGPGNWAVVAQLLGGQRTDSDVARRWAKLRPEAAAQSALRKREEKKIKPSFVKQRKDWPALLQNNDINDHGHNEMMMIDDDDRDDYHISKERE